MMKRKRKWKCSLEVDVVDLDEYRMKFL